MLLDIIAVSNTLYESLDLIGQWIMGRGREKETRSKATVGTMTDNHISRTSEGAGQLPVPMACHISSVRAASSKLSTSSLTWG